MILNFCLIVRLHLDLASLYIRLERLFVVDDRQDYAADRTGLP